MTGDTGEEPTSVGDAFELLAARDRQVWVAAVVLYGVGDTATTLWGISTGGVAEVGPVAAPLIETYGRVALLGIKAVTFASFYVLWRVLHTPGRVAVPLALATVGAVVTAWNLAVVAGA